MRFAFTEEQQELRAMARSFLAEHSTGEHIREVLTTDLGYDDKVWQRIGAELGWPAIIVPEEYGGLGLSYVELVGLLECMGEALLCSPFFSSVCLGGNALLHGGTVAQKQQYLPQLAQGQLRLALAITEANGLWNSQGIETTATRAGDEFVLSGSKRYVLDGHCADLLVVAARAEGTKGHEGVSLFLVEPGSEGLDVQPLPTMDQTRRLAQIELQEVRVPASSLMGKEGEGIDALHKTLDLASIALAAEQVGGAQRSLDLAVEYAKGREQFGRPIAGFQAIKHKCADMMVAVECARSAAYYAGCVAAEDSDEIPIAASLAKATASEAFFRCAADNIQIHGGVGFTWEYDPHLYFKRAKSTEAFLGDPSYHRERIAKHIL